MEREEEEGIDAKERKEKEKKKTREYKRCEELVVLNRPEMEIFSLVPLPLLLPLHPIL